MNEIIVIFHFDDKSDHWGLESCLDDHPQIQEWMREHDAVKLTPNAFLIMTEEDCDHIISEFTPFLDRGEDVFVISTKTSNGWSAVASSDTLSAIRNFDNELQSPIVEEPDPIIEHEDIS